MFSMAEKPWIRFALHRPNQCYFINGFPGNFWTTVLRQRHLLFSFTNTSTKEIAQDPSPVPPPMKSGEQTLPLYRSGARTDKFIFELFPNMKQSSRASQGRWTLSLSEHKS